MKLSEAIRAGCGWRFLKYKLAWWRWFLSYPGYRFWDRTLDKASRDIIEERHMKKEPTWTSEPAIDPRENHT